MPDRRAVAVSPTTGPWDRRVIALNGSRFGRRGLGNEQNRALGRLVQQAADRPGLQGLLAVAATGSEDEQLRTVEWLAIRGRFVLPETMRIDPEFGPVPVNRLDGLGEHLPSDRLDLPRRRCASGGASAQGPDAGGSR
jgi:hypothetical protein